PRNRRSHAAFGSHIVSRQGSARCSLAVSRSALTGGLPRLEPKNGRGAPGHFQIRALAAGNLSHGGEVKKRPNANDTRDEFSYIQDMNSDSLDSEMKEKSKAD